jgi:acetyl-CoA carboxylase biotin carboxyl carrier protein
MGKKLTKAQFNRIEELVDLFVQEALSDLTVEEEGLYVEITGPRIAVAPVYATPAAAAAPVAAARGPRREAHWENVQSPMTGVFYRASAPDQPAFIDIGQTVSVGQTIGLIEAMKVFSEVPSPVAGRVVEIPAANAALVAEGDPLIVVDPRG